MLNAKIGNAGVCCLSFLLSKLFVEVYAIVESPLLNTKLQMYAILFGMPLLNPHCFDSQIFCSVSLVLPCIPMSHCDFSFMNVALILDVISQDPKGPWYTRASSLVSMTHELRQLCK